jgi:hypothetical protein
MKELLNEWREYSEHHELFERHDYIQNVLGIKPLLNENGGMYYSSEIRKLIIEEQLLFEGFFDRFNPIEAIKKYGKEVGQLFSTLHSVVRNPKYIPDFISSAIKKIINSWKQKITTAITWLEGKNMPTFAAGLKKIISGIDSVIAMDVNWKKAVVVTGLIIGLAYLFDKMKDFGADIFSGLTDIGEQVINAAENFLMKEFPKIVSSLYGKTALMASSGFLGWVAAAFAVIKVVNLAKEALLPMFAKYKELTRRRDIKDSGSIRDPNTGRIRLETKSI